MIDCPSPNEIPCSNRFSRFQRWEEDCLSIDYPAEFSSAGIVYLPLVDTFRRRDVAIGLTMVNRLRFHGDSGDDVWDEYASTLLSLAMVDLDDDFSGEVRSKTMDIRFSLAFSLLEKKRLLLGFSYIHLD
jgi:hypothetical protein